jgi:signal transduction histidine kinase
MATSNRGTRAATFGLAGVFACLAAFSIFAAYTTRAQADKAETLVGVREAYDTAISAIRAEETAEIEYQLEPSPAHHEGLREANDAVLRAITQVAAKGGQDNQQLGREMAALHDLYLIQSALQSAAIAAGDLAEAHRLDVNEIDPILHAMERRLVAVAEERTAQSESAFQELRDTGLWLLILAPVVFAIGFGLMLALWRILEGYHRETRKTYREIEQLSKLRSEFVSIVSHEFRTPLTGIQGFSEVMRDEALTMPEVREYAADINKDARRLARLITDMLDLDRMESGRMTLNCEPVDLNRIVADTAAQFRLTAADHPIALDLDPRLPMLMGDSDRLTQVVSNLVTNAIKYSPSGGAIELRTKRVERTVTFTVRDRGIGIPAEKLETIFDRYARVQTTETRGIQGTGLGLPIVRQIVQLSDGKVWATSELGQGSVLHVQLPLVEATSLSPLTA